MASSPSAADDLPEKLDRSHELLYVQMIFLILAGISVLIRIYVKTVIVKHNALDDFLIYGAMIGYTVYGTIAIDSVINGATGKHSSLGFSMEEAARSLRGWYISMVLYAPVTLAIRASVCVLLLRLTTSKLYKRIIYFNLIGIAALSAAYFFIMVFQCSPPSYFWTQVLGEPGYCHNKLIVTYSTAVHSSVSAVSDWCLGLLPIALLWHVKINHRTKAIVAVLLSLGMIAGVALIVRIPYITRLPPGLDFLYKSIDVAIWSVMEPALGIIAACVASFRPLFRSWGFGVRSTNAYPSGHIQLSNAKNTGRLWDTSQCAYDAPQSIYRHYSRHGVSDGSKAGLMDKQRKRSDVEMNLEGPDDLTRNQGRDSVKDLSDVRFPEAAYQRSQDTAGSESRLRRD